MASTLGVHNPLRYRGYVYDNETELYYLQSRYYDPDVGRFINADAFASTSQGILGNNMFAYCRNNPVSRIDPSGTYDCCLADDDLGDLLSDNIRHSGGASGGLSYSGSSLGGIVAPVVSSIFAIGSIGSIAREANKKIILSKTNEDEKDVVIAKTRSGLGTTYYHVTTMESAAIIASTNVMFGSAWEGGYVYAWKTMPSKYAIRNSGAHFGVIISFKTNASFTSDPGIDDPKVAMYGPVVSVRPGPILVWDVKIVGIEK